MTAVVLAVFVVVYAGMLLGSIPGLALDRTGIAVVGAIALVVGGVLTPEQAWGAVDVGTMALLFGLMLVAAQLRLGGFYTAVTRRLGDEGLGPLGLLALLVVSAGLLAALLSNDIVCLAVAPAVLEMNDRCNERITPSIRRLPETLSTSSKEVSSRFPRRTRSCSEESMLATGLPHLGSHRPAGHCDPRRLPEEVCSGTWSWP